MIGRSTSAGAAGALLVSFGGALAADPAAAPVTDLFAPAVYDWSGAYFGVQGGWKVSSETESHGPGIFGRTDLNISGAAAGIFGGYNWQRGRWVYGIEADASAVFGAEDSRAIQIQLPTGLTAPGTLEGEMTFNGNLRGRVGYAFDRILPYVAVGVAAARYEGVVTRTGVFREESEKWFVEWSAGAGIEYAPIDNLHLRIEYLYEHFDNEDVFSSVDESQGLKPHVFRVGAAWRFGRL